MAILGTFMSFFYTIFTIWQGFCQFYHILSIWAFFVCFDHILIIWVIFRCFGPIYGHFVVYYFNRTLHSLTISVYMVYFNVYSILYHWAGWENGIFGNIWSPLDHVDYLWCMSISYLFTYWHAMHLVGYLRMESH